MNNKSFISSAKIVLIAVFVGKILGLLKQIVLAYYFGASDFTDLFFSSYSFISEICTAFFSAISVVLLKNYGVQKSKTQKNANKLFSSSLLFFSIISITITILLCIFPEIIVTFIAPGYNTINKNFLSSYIRYLSPVIILYSIQIHLTAVLDYEKKFLPGKILPLILNSLIILSVIIFKDKYEVIPLLIAVLLSYIIQIIYSLYKIKGFVSLSFNNPLKNESFKKILTLIIPLFIGNAIIELNSIVDRAVASNLSSGSISALTYGASINEIITILLISTLSSIFYSYASSFVVDNKPNELKNYFFKISKVLLIILIPVSIIMIFFSKEIVSILYMRGSFDSNALNNTSLIVIGYAIGFIPTMLRSLLIKIHYAYDDTKNPMINGIITISINIALSILLTKIFGIIGISVATSIAMSISALICLITVRKHIKINFTRKLIRQLVKIIIITIILVIISYVLYNLFAFNYFIRLFFSVLSICVIYYMLLIIFKLDNSISLLLKIIKRRVR